MTLRPALLAACDLPARFAIDSSDGPAPAHAYHCSTFVLVRALGGSVCLKPWQRVRVLLMTPRERAA